MQGMRQTQVQTLVNCAGGQEENLVALDNYQLKIKAYKIRSKYGDKIGGSSHAKPHHTPPVPKKQKQKLWSALWKHVPTSASTAPAL